MMNTILEWLKPGVKVKRYIFAQLVAIGLIIFSAVTLANRENLTVMLLIAYVILITLSIFTVIFSFIMAQKNILELSLKHIANNDKRQDIKNLLYANDQLKKGPKIVMIGGGSGLSNILRGLRQYTSNITAIVTTFDDGGSTGKLRDELDVLAPGDIRKCIAALSESEPTMEKLLSYRFKDGTADNHALGNLILVAMTEITGSFQKAIEKISSIFSVRGKVLPVTLQNLRLCAALENDEVILGEASIQTNCLKAHCGIKQVFLKKNGTECVAAPGVVEAIKDADLIVIGPGSLYTSVICNLLVDGVSEAIIKSNAKKLYICNLMTQPGETDGYTVAKHVNEIERYVGKHVLDYALINNGEITKEMLVEFNQGESKPVKIDLENIQNRTISVIQDDLVVTAKDSILHNNKKIAEILVDVARKKKIGNMNILKEKTKKKHKKNAKNIIAQVKSETKKIDPKVVTEKAKSKVDKKSKKVKKNKNTTKIINDVKKKINK